MFEASFYQKSLLLYLHFLSLSKSNTQVQLCNGLHAVARRPKHSLRAVCESAHPWLPALRMTGGAGNFSNFHVNVEREL